MLPEKTAYALPAQMDFTDFDALPSVNRREFGKAAFVAAAGFLLPLHSFAMEPKDLPSRNAEAAKNIVLVHGAFADGSSWGNVIPLLEAKGFNVTAVQNPLTSLAEDVATTRRLLAQQNGPTVLVGHSYAGFVITEAGHAPNVTALVYISSYGPAEGESHDDLVKRYPAPAGIPAIRLDGDGYLWVARDKFREAFAHDVDAAQADIMAAIQKPVSKKNCFGMPAGAPAWKAKPSWFLISTEDRLINPDLQRFMATRMGATAATAPSSHASLVSHPVETARLIAVAAGLKA
jgi:pimeloyl-ACP methyl ester carboxylesterase